MNKYYITGSSNGLGKALVNTLIQEEANLITGISRSNEFEHPRFTHLSIDLNQPQELLNQLDSIFDEAGGFEKVVLINNAGYLGSIKYLGDIDDQEFIRIYNVNLTAPALLSNAFIRKYKNDPCKKILLNISSGASQNPYDGWSGYCSSKAALDMLSKVAALENEERGRDFTIISLAPGVIDTDMQDQIRHAAEDDFSSRSRFQSLKDENKLLSPEKAAQQIIQFLNNVDLHPEVIQDIRNLNQTI